MTTPTEPIVHVDVRRHILADMRQIWLNTRYQTEIELKIQDRLHQTLGRTTDEIQRSLTDRLRDVAVALDMIEEELASL